ncbi:MAG: glycosyltransferase family 4 protein [Proteobacteria bacterium]|nr:glycosyltransferase family 4 protein [Pseudomonadota bacterium]
MNETNRLRIVHIVRAPIGGIFRHIVDLATAQADAGHAVGLICDSSTGGEFERRAVETISARLELGAIRLPMQRRISSSDLAAVRRVLTHLGSLYPDVIHGHGAKGGAYGRQICTWLRRRRRVLRIYSPHGGSLHHDRHTLAGRAYFSIERQLERMTDAIIHVSEYEARTYRAKIGQPRCRSEIIRNGLRPDEFALITPAPDAGDLLYLGMFRDLKGLDVFLEAVGILGSTFNRTATANIIGQADADFPRYQALAAALGITDRVTFHKPMPTRAALAMGRMIVVPSRAESMPYVVLEAIAAGMPIVATHVGGIPEIIAADTQPLVAPGDALALAAGIDRMLASEAQGMKIALARRKTLQDRFSLATMHHEIEKLYRDELKRGAETGQPASRIAAQPPAQARQFTPN